MRRSAQRSEDGGRSGPRLRHRLGQHLLTDLGVLEDMTGACVADSAVPLIEIGAGTGVLTEAVAKARAKGDEETQGQERTPLIAVECDQRLISSLTERVRRFPFVRVVKADILKVSVQSLLPTPSSRPPPPYDVIGNIPYNITAPIIQKFLAHPPRPRRMTLLLDEAVADVLVAVPPDMSVRTISVQVYAEPQILHRRIPPSAFTPPPAVHSAIIRLVTRPDPLIRPADERAFFRLVRAGFSQKRKILANALAATYRLTPRVAAETLRASGIAPSRRAETLSIPEWKHLLRLWEKR